MLSILIWAIICAVAAKVHIVGARFTYRSRVTRCIPLDGNAWLLAFGAEIVTPPSISAIKALWFGLWLVGCMIWRVS